MENKPSAGHFMLFLKKCDTLYALMAAETAARFSLTRSEIDVLSMLAAAPDCDTAREVSQLGGFSKAYVSKAVMLLMTKGLVSIRPSKSDRRKQHLTMTPKAEPVAAAIFEMQNAFTAALTDGLSPDETAHLGRATDYVASNAVRAAAPYLAASDRKARINNQ